MRPYLIKEEIQAWCICINTVREKHSFSTSLIYKNIEGCEGQETGSVLTARQLLEREGEIERGREREREREIEKMGERGKERERERERERDCFIILTARELGKMVSQREQQEEKAAAC